MANTSINLISFFVQGDGIATTAAINLGFTPSAIAFVSATIPAGTDVSANVTSATLVGSTVNVVFVAPFAYTIAIVLNVTLATTGNVSVSNFPVTQPISIASMPSTPVTGTFWQTTQPVSLAANQSVNFTLLNGVALGSPSAYGTSPGAVNVEGVNAFITNTPAVTISSGNVTTVSTVTALTTITNAVKIEGSTGATVDGVINGAASTNMLWTANAPSTASAAACSFSFINATGAAASLKASVGNLYGFTLTNNQGATVFVEFFNVATVPVLGTTAVVMAYEIPTGGVLSIPPGTLALAHFTTGLGFGCTTAENGSTAASVTGVVWYL